MRLAPSPSADRTPVADPAPPPGSTGGKPAKPPNPVTTGVHTAPESAPNVAQTSGATQGVYAADHLDQPIRVLSGRLWAAALALVVLIGAGTAWAVVGTLPHHLSARGVLVHGRGPLAAAAPKAGALLSVTVGSGEQVHRDQVVAIVATPDGPTPVHAPADGAVMNVVAVPGQQLDAGAAVVLVDPGADPRTAPAQAVLFVTSREELSSLQPGQQTHLALAGGVLAGHISAVAGYPSSAAELVSRFGSQRVPGVDAGRDVWLVEVGIDAAGAEIGAQIPAMSPVAASILISRDHPLRVLFGQRR